MAKLGPKTRLLISAGAVLFVAATIWLGILLCRSSRYNYAGVAISGITPDGGVLELAIPDAGIQVRCTMGKSGKIIGIPPIGRTSGIIRVRREGEVLYEGFVELNLSPNTYYAFMAEISAQDPTADGYYGPGVIKTIEPQDANIGEKLWLLGARHDLTEKGMWEQDKVIVWTKDESLDNVLRQLAEQGFECERYKNSSIRVRRPWNESLVSLSLRISEMPGVRACRPIAKFVY